MGKIKTVLSIGCIAAACAVASTLLMEERTVQTQAEGVVKECALEETYRVGTNVEIGNAVLTYKGQDYTSNGFVITYPDMLSKSGSTSYELSNVGEYEVAYTYDSEELKLKAVKNFTVLDSIYSFTTQTGLEYTSVLDGEAEGLKLTYSPADVFTYNQPIDLKEISKIASVNILQDCTAPEAAMVKFTLTDAYDEANYIDIVLYYSAYNKQIYGRAAAHNQEQHCCVAVTAEQDIPKGKKEFYINGQRYYARVTTASGLALGKYNTFSVYYEEATGDIYLQNYKGKQFITNVYNPSINENLFEGFKTGEVIVSVSVEEFVGNSLAIEVSELGGNSGEQLKECLYKDTLAPEVYVDCPENRQIQIAKDQSVNVFSASAIDVNLTGEVSVACYYNYGSNIQTQVAITDGAFTPKHEGLYTLVYQAKDAYGNIGTELIWLKSVKAKGIFWIEGENPAFYAGVQNEIGYSFAGLNEQFAVKLTASNEYESLAIGSDGVFTPAYSGEYLLTAEFSDGIFTQTQTKTLTVLVSQKHAFLEKPVLQPYFVSQKEYSMPDITAYEFSQGKPNAVETKCFLIEDGKEKRLVDVNACTIEAEREVIVRYESAADESVYVESEPSKVVSLANEYDGLDLKKAFVGDFTATYDDGGVRYEANATKGNASLDYINPISLSNFQFSVKINASDANFSALRLRLTDYVDESVYRDILLINDAGNVFMQIGDSAPKYYAANFDAVGQLSFRYVASNDALYYSDSNYLTLGAAFLGDRVFLNVSLLDVKGKAAFYAYQINNLTLTDLGGDYIEPSISVKESTGVWEIGSKVKISVPEVSDELSGVLRSQIFVTVTGPDRKPIKDVNGTLLDGFNITQELEVELSSYGNYSVLYTVSDTAYNEAQKAYRITVGDTANPTIVLQKGYSNDCKKVGKLGSTVEIAKASVSDNVSQPNAIQLKVYVFNPDGTISETPKRKLTLSKRGAYTVCYLATDEAGNSTFVSYTIICE